MYLEKREDWRGYRRTSSINRQVLIAEMSIKEQNRFKEYLEDKCECTVRIKREKGIVTFLVHPKKAKEVKHYIFDNYNYLMDNYEFKSFELDITKDF